MKKGDIILIPFPFTDLTGLKNRPALVLISLEKDVTVAFISSQIKPSDEFEVMLEPSPKNGLKKSSLLKVTKLATIEKNLILGKLGELSKEDLDRVDASLVSAFQLLKD